MKSNFEIKYHLFDLRKQKNLTERELSALSGVSKSQINNIETGSANRKSPSWNHFFFRQHPAWVRSQNFVATPAAYFINSSISIEQNPERKTDEPIS